MSCSGSCYIQEKRVREIVLKAMGQAISKTVAIAEIIKVGSYFARFTFGFVVLFDRKLIRSLNLAKQKRIPRLHQDTAISSVSITDVWEPMEEGLVP